MDNIERQYPVRLMIAGAQKSGTTSLLNYLSQHPGICRHNSAELPYFSRKADYDLSYAEIFRRYYTCAASTPPQVVIAKSIGMLVSPEAQSRLRDHNAGVHLVAILRNPVDRAYSSYWYARRRGWEDLSTFEEALDADPSRLESDRAMKMNCNYLDSGIYIKHVRSMLNYFDQDQVHLYLLEDLKHDPLAVCRSLFELFDELDSSFEPAADRTYNPSAVHRSRSLALLTSSRSTLPAAKKIVRQLLPDQLIDNLRDAVRHANERDNKNPPMSMETRARLLDYFRPYNQELATLIGRNLDHWHR